MADNDGELRQIAWSQAFPFVRLFKTTALALSFNRMALALIAVLCCYFSGRILDRLWSDAGAVAVMPQGQALINEVAIYADTNHQTFNAWVNQARANHESMALGLLMDADRADSEDQARELLQSDDLRDLLISDEFAAELDELREHFNDDWLEEQITLLESNEQLSADERAESIRDLQRAADTVRTMLAGKYGPDQLAKTDWSETVRLVCGGESKTAGDLMKRVTEAARIMTGLRQYERLAPRGPFAALLSHGIRCFGAAIQGVCNGRFGFNGGAFSAEPAMAGSIVSAVRGGCWLANQRPCYGTFFGILNLLIFAYFGGAICRSAAMQTARDESISIGESLKFVRERFSGFLVAPLLPIALAIGIGVIMAFGGLLGTVGYLGELFAGGGLILALLGGFALAMLVLAVVLGFHLMWPTIAVEGSDGFDALSRACSYVGHRIWHVGFYSFVLLIYGAFSFVLVRLVALLVLKLTHKCVGMGMNLTSSAELADVGKLNAMWSMPAWADLSLLPTAGGLPLWGAFRTAPLDGFESLSAVLLMIWIFIFVGLLGAFVVSYFFCGSTQMYFLLRNGVDATDYDEIYYEEPAEETPIVDEPAPTAADEPTSEPDSDSDSDDDGNSDEDQS